MKGERGCWDTVYGMWNVVCGMVGGTWKSCVGTVTDERKGGAEEVR